MPEFEELVTVPTDLTLIGEQELQSLHDSAVAEFDRVGQLLDELDAHEDVTSESLEHGTRLLDYTNRLTVDIERLRTEQNVRETRAASTARRQHATTRRQYSTLRTRVHGDGDGGEPAIEGDRMSVEAVTAAAARGATEALVRVLGDRLGGRHLQVREPAGALTAASRYAPPPAVPPRLEVTANVDIPGVASGQRIGTVAQLSEYVTRKARAMPVTNGNPNRQLVASVRSTFPNTIDDRTSPAAVEELVRHLTRREVRESLVAGGGFCFGPDTLVNTPDGLVPIEDLSVDDMVLTGSGKARRVALVLTREAQRYELRAHGTRTVVTPEHPVWASRRRRSSAGNKIQANLSTRMRWERPAWIPAGDLRQGDRVAFAVDALGEPSSAQAPTEVDLSRAYILGRYLGDGWTSRKRKASGSRNDMYASYLCCAHGEAEDLEKALVKAEIRYSRQNLLATTRFNLASEFRDWVTELGAGAGAHDKAVPNAVFSWSDASRSQVLSGYVDADGYTKQVEGSSDRISAVTVCRELAVGIGMLARTLGYSPGIAVRQARVPSRIDGREIKSSTVYRLDWVAGEQRKKRHEAIDGVMWEVVQSFTPLDVGTVYDITVDDAEHSFIADGMVVHNCSPSEVRYDFFNIACSDGLVDLPTFGVDRGGIRYPTSPSLADVFSAIAFGGVSVALAVTSVPWLWTEASDTAAATGSPTKPCVRVPCPTFNEVRLDCIGECITAGNLTESAYPEAVSNFLGLMSRAHERAMNGRQLAQMTSLSAAAINTGSFAVTGQPVYQQIYGGISLAVTDYRERYGMCQRDVIEVVAPHWLRAAIRADLAWRNGVPPEQVPDSALDMDFSTLGARVQWVSDYQVRGSGQFGHSTAMTAWPTSATLMVFAAGTFVRGNGLSLDLGVVRDSTLNSTNDHTAGWSEECFLVARFGHESRQYTITFAVNGRTGSANGTGATNL